MSYLVLARKYRPATFAEVSGQEQVTRTLVNAIKRDKIAHAFLFCGPRGVGKTSVARILSRSLNCKNGPTADPCGECPACREIAEGSSLAVREIDGASHNSVDNVRDLIDTFRSLPAPGYRYKIYIIDEVHMLSVSAFNALLKSLEEPPPHTIFVLATTEAHKIPETVVSRCQQHTFRALRVDSIEARLAQIAKSEGMKVEEGVLRMVAAQADGSMRDAQSLLDKLQLFCEGKITLSEASRLLGAAEKSRLFALSESILSNDGKKALEIVSDCFATGIDISLFVRDFVAHWRELLIARAGGESMLRDAAVPAEEAREAMNQVRECDSRRVLRLQRMAREGGDAALRSAFPKYMLEALVVQMSLGEEVGRKNSEGKGAAQTGSTAKAAGSPQAARHSEKRGSAPHGSLREEERQPDRPAPRSAGGSVKAAGGGFVWGEFAAFVAENGSRFLFEHMKRVSPQEFDAGTLHLRGPAFSIAFLQRDEEKTRLKELLEKWSSHEAWTFKFEQSGSEADEGSLLHVEQAQERNMREAKRKDISAHPKIQSLRKAFPGSEIEDIKIKKT